MTEQLEIHVANLDCDHDVATLRRGFAACGRFLRPPDAACVKRERVLFRRALEGRRMVYRRRERGAIQSAVRLPIRNDATGHRIVFSGPNVTDQAGNPSQGGIIVFNFSTQ